MKRGRRVQGRHSQLTRASRVPSETPRVMVNETGQPRDQEHMSGFFFILCLIKHPPTLPRIVTDLIVGSDTISVPQSGGNLGVSQEASYTNAR